MEGNLRFRIYDNISLNSSYNVKYSNKSCKENQSTRFMFSKIVFESRKVYEIISKNRVEPERP